MNDLEKLLLERLDRMERNQAQILARLDELAGTPAGLSAVREVEVRELALQIHTHGWPERKRRKKQ